MVHHRLGHEDEARRWLAKGRGWHATDEFGRQDRLVFQILLREAAVLLEGRRKT